MYCFILSGLKLKRSQYIKKEDKVISDYVYCMMSCNDINGIVHIIIIKNYFNVNITLYLLT